MVVSLHLAGYPSARSAGLALLAYRRRRRGGLPAGLAAGALCRTAPFSSLTSQRPTLRRWAMLCCWDDADAPGEFIARSPLIAALEERASESWHLQLQPVRVQGSWRGWGESVPPGERLAPDEPAVALISGRLSPRMLPRFTWDNARVVSQLDRDPGVLASLALHDTPLTMTSFSVWRSTDAMNRFAHGSGTTHRRVMEATPRFDNHFFARFRPVASSGAWDGRDPLGGIGGC